MDKKTFTIDPGVPVADNHTPLTPVPRGLSLLKDAPLIAKRAHFNRERIPKRVVYAKGAGAHGYFPVYRSMAEFTMVTFLNDPEKKIPVLQQAAILEGLPAQTP